MNHETAFDLFLVAMGTCATLIVAAIFCHGMSKEGSSLQVFARRIARNSLGAITLAVVPLYCGYTSVSTWSDGSYIVSVAEFIVAITVFALGYGFLTWTRKADRPTNQNEESA